MKVTYTWCMGGISFFLFLLLTITGVFLMFFYVPDTNLAYQNINTLSSAIVSFGHLVRNMHRWAAHLMIVSVTCHMIRVFYHGAYKPPREFNWVIGVLLFIVTLFLSFTGYLLPWDQIAIWAITVGTNLAPYTPILGDAVLQGPAWQLGSRTVNPGALLCGPCDLSAPDRCFADGGSFLAYS